MLSPLSPQVTTGPSGLQVSSRWRAGHSYPLQRSQPILQHVTLGLCFCQGYQSLCVCVVIRHVRVGKSEGWVCIRVLRTAPFRGPAAHQAMGHTSMTFPNPLKHPLGWVLSFHLWENRNPTIPRV